MMESDNGFGAGIEAPVDDPFANTSASEFDQTGSDPLADPEPEQAPPPLVNREGQVIEPGAEDETQVESPEEQAMRESAEAELAEQEAAAPVADPLPAATESTSSEEPGAAAGSEPTAEAEVDPPQADAPASSATPTSAQETPSSPAARAAAAPATSHTDDGPSSASATATASTDEDAPPDNNVAPLPEELKDKSGAITHRRYVLLTPEGNGKHREVSWYEDKTGKMVKKGAPGAKKQSVCLARGQEEALAIGYNAMGSPEGGVPLRAVALTYWGELTHVEPDPDPPIRQRLKFRR